MSKLNAIAKWVTIIVMLIASIWTGFLAYLNHEFINLHSLSESTLFEHASLATFASVNYWPILVLFSLCSLISSFCLLKIVRVPTAFYLVISPLILISAMTLNILVVSAGFELSSIQEQLN